MGAAMKVDPVPDAPARPPHEQVDLERAEDRAYWVDGLGVSREALARVIEIVGPCAEDVWAYLREEGLPGDTAS
jgi:hypothetical protein